MKQVDRKISNDVEELNNYQSLSVPPSIIPLSFIYPSIIVFISLSIEYNLFSQYLTYCFISSHIFSLTYESFIDKLASLSPHYCIHFSLTTIVSHPHVFIYLTTVNSHISSSVLSYTHFMLFT